MITLTDNQKEMLRSNNVKKNWTFEIYSGNAFIGYIPTANMVDDSFSIKEALSTSETIEIGACEAATLAVQVADISYSLKGKNLKVWLNVESGGESLTLPMGRFYVDECKNKNGTYFYNITAYDGMSLFDVDVSGWYKGLSFPVTLKEMRDSLCKYIGVEQESVTLPCDNISISESISNFSLTGRNVLKAICQLNGCFGHFTREGNLTYVYLNNTSTLTLKEGGEDCYQTSATHEETTSGEFDSVSITPYESGSSDDGNAGYPEDGDALRTLCVQDNFLTYGMDGETLSGIAAIIYENVIGHPYVVHNTPTQGRVWQEVGDAITLEVESYGEMVTFDTFILERTLSGFQAASDTYAAKGTETSDSLSASSAREMAAATSVLAKAEAIVSARETALREFNSIISSAIGLYEITVTDDDGAVTYYYANAPTIKEATLVYTFNSGGFAWGTKELNSEDLPEWKYGISNDGNAILNYLYVNKLTSDYVTVTEIDAVTGTIGGLKIDANSITSDNGNFSLTSKGALYAKSAEIEGKITCGEGTIGGFTIGSSSLYSTKTAYDSTTAGVYLGNDGIGLGAGTFYVTSAGAMTATSGKIGGFTIDSTRLYYSKQIELNAEGGTIYCFDGTNTNINETSGANSFSNLDYQGVGIIYRTSSESVVPYYKLDCSANNGLVISYSTTAGISTSRLSLYLDSSNSYYPTIKTNDYLFINARHMTLDVVMKGTLSGSWYLDTGDAVTSDSNRKNSIETLSDEYTVLFDSISPVRFKYNYGTSDRYHTGFIAQDLKTAIENAGLSTQDVAAYVEYEDDDGTTVCAVRYTEIIALCVNEIQKLKSRVAVLERG